VLAVFVCEDAAMKFSEMNQAVDFFAHAVVGFLIIGFALWWWLG
jgi:hypothetical protein